ncbi:hypothetical protein Tco_0267511 [Tanacetum coccineum]
MPTEMELTLEQTQQGVSYEVLNIRVISITMKMEILLEPTSNKLMVDPYGFEGISKDGDGGPTNTSYCIVSEIFFMESVSHLSTLTDSIILILVLFFTL